MECVILFTCRLSADASSAFGTSEVQRQKRAEVVLFHIANSRNHPVLICAMFECRQLIYLAFVQALSIQCDRKNITRAETINFIFFTSENAISAPFVQHVHHKYITG